MEVNSIKSSVRKFQNNSLSFTKKLNNIDCGEKTYRISTNKKTKNNISFGKIHFMYILKSWSKYMEKPSEGVNTVINAIGTGLIAPFAIMCSPKKPCRNPKQDDDKKDRDKKFFQAVRQPVSAALAFALTMPTAILINKVFGDGAYKKHWGIFNDKYLNHLIPDENYLKKQAEKILSGKASPELKAEWAQELNLAQNREQMLEDFKNNIKQEIEQVKDTISENELEKIARNKRKVKKFTAEKMAQAKQERMIQEKIQELAERPTQYSDLEFVTEKYMKKAKETYSSEFEALKKKANLRWYDKLLNFIGLQNKKVETFERAVEQKARERGLEFLKKDMGSEFDIYIKKLDMFVRTRCTKSQTLFKNKVFWLSVGVNAFMFGVSGLTLNWLHPKLAAFIDKRRGKSPEQANMSKKNVEVGKCG